MEIQENVELKPHTVFKIGGQARYFCEARTLEDLREAVHFARDKSAPFFLLGAGSNVLISDRGFGGVAIKMMLQNLSISGMHVGADAGVSMARATAETIKAGLAGFEWAIGIPGTIGGSVRGNAGCYGKEMKDVLHSVRVFDAMTDELRVLSRRECHFGYRDSIFKKNPSWIVVSMNMYLESGVAQDSQKLVGKYSLRRRATQDIGAQCAGCMFKNVLWGAVDKSSLTKKFPDLREFSASPVIPAAFLIDRLDLKGIKIRGATVSTRHANYFVNVDNSTAEDVMALVSLVKDRVHRTYGILLEEEVQFIS
ncbi:MAG: UDP-N-acetylmuramate dehydrogenase [Candidatus Niyogibacteria bacterium]|nr:UDP-N-acetylmuramate dehydrogenase [Candidatus Niyogibacteria bacterium]